MMKKILLILCFIPWSILKAQYFQQEVNYTINVKLDDIKHELTADESIEYINNSPDELSFIYFHLWPNAYKNNNTALARQILESGNRKLYYAPENDKGFIDGLHFQVNGRNVEWEYDSVHIDICKIKLNEGLKSGERITITTPFHVKIPKGVFSRLGHIDQSYQITQWYPKPAVYDQYGWHQMPYLNQGEFYSEFGSFDISITLPKNYVLGATGDLVKGEAELEWLDHLVKETEKINEYPKFDSVFPPSSTELKTLRFKQSKVHDFAWFADKRYHVLKGEVELPHSKRKVTTWAMFTNSEAHLWKKSIEYLNDAVYYYSLWNGDYPYDHATAVDGALSAGGGMEYPNITVIGRSGTAFLLEMVIMHEVGHNWFYGILGSNEREHPWMDEGINSFNENRYIRTKYPKALMLGLPSDKKIVNLFDLKHCKAKCQYYFGYLFPARIGKDQPIELPAVEYTNTNYGTIVYYKTAIVFDYLMAYLGEEAMDKAMKKYFDTWKFRHPYPQDLRKILEEETGKNLNWFFDDMISSTKKLDYKISGLEYQKDSNDMVFPVLKIKNIGQIEGPFSISGMRNDTMIFKEWFDGFSGEKTIELGASAADEFMIDGNIDMPEIDQRNNTIRTKGLMKKVEPFRLQFLGSIENPSRTQLFYSPVWGWNNYNKNMLGIAFYNNLFPQKKFEYLISPMYALGNGSWTGTGSVFYNWFPQAGAVQNARIGLNTSTFDYLDFTFPSDPGLLYSRKTSRFLKIAPEINVMLRKSKDRSSRQKSFTIRTMSIATNNSFYFNSSGTKFSNYNNILINDFSYFFKENRTMNPWGYTVNFQGSENFLKSSLEIYHRFEYSKGKGMDLRLFAGKFIYNNTTNPYFNWRMDGQNGLYDYSFDHIFLGRTESEGLMSQQFNENHGAFKTPSPVGQSNVWISSLNIKMELPFKLPVGIFADAGIYPDGFDVKYVYDAGIHAWIAKGFCDIYIPLFYSESIGRSLKARGLNFAQTIRFTLNIHKLNPANLTREIDI